MLCLRSLRMGDRRAMMPDRASDMASRSNAARASDVRVVTRQTSLMRRLPPSRVPPIPNGGVPPIVYEALRGPGAPLDVGTRSLMESRLGHDFTHVRVHTDERAVASARAVGALAYTV